MYNPRLLQVVTGDSVAGVDYGESNSQSLRNLFIPQHVAVVVQLDDSLRVLPCGRRWIMNPDIKILSVIDQNRLRIEKTKLVLDKDLTLGITVAFKIMDGLLATRSGLDVGSVLTSQNLFSGTSGEFTFKEKMSGRSISWNHEKAKAIGLSMVNYQVTEVFPSEHYGKLLEADADLRECTDLKIKKVDLEYMINLHEAKKEAELRETISKLGRVAAASARLDDREVALHTKELASIKVDQSCEDITKRERVKNEVSRDLRETTLRLTYVAGRSRD